MVSCTTKKNNFFFRSYHGITTRFNIYYNGNESYKEAVEVIDYAAKDNYTSILPVFIAPDKTEALKSAPQLDRTIEKCSKAIKKHSMYIKGVEYCKPIPETYLLMGKAYFKRQDYGDALGIFNYIIHTHANLKVCPEAQTWKARTLIAMNRLAEAEEVLETARLPISNCKNDKYKLHWEANFADYYLKIKDYEQAALYLTEILKHKRVKKDFRTRIHFILGQVHQQLGQNTDAAEHYTFVLKKTPPYEMEFNAAINLALCTKESSKDEKTAYDKLRKMLRDERNITYKDQIFYALAMLDLRDERTNDAISNLEASVFWSIDNLHQKTLSSHTLAEMYFNRNQFIEAQAHYDTVINIIPPSYPDYAQIKDRAAILKRLVQNLVVINVEDSLQRIARMDENERKKYIDSLIEQYKINKAARDADEDAKKDMMDISKKMNNASRASSSSAAWLFYNPTQVKFGMQEFRKRWGNRKLEDYWAISDISVMDFLTDMDTQEQFDTSSNADNSALSDKKTASARTADPENPAYYLQDVPFTQIQMDSSNEAIVNALYNAGMIYYEDLHEAKKAVKLLEDLVERFPKHKLYPLTCFQLYKIYTAVNNIAKSDYYKNLILEKYPDSDYARVINNPDFYKQLAAVKDEANAFYSSVYAAFVKKNYPTVVHLANEGLVKYPTPELSPKFEFLKAIALGKLNGNDTLKTLLRDISYKFPTTEIDTAAMGILEALKQLETATPVQINSSQQQNTNSVVNAPLYTYDGNSLHLVIIIVNVKDVNVSQLKSKIAAFNREFFRLDKFDVNNFYADAVNQIITINQFQNKGKAMDYFNLIKTDTTLLEYLGATPSTKIYVISDDNYIIFYKRLKNKEEHSEYDDFFKEYYLKK